MHAVDLPRWDRDFTEQRLVRHAIVALRIVRRNAALVTEPDVDMGPINLLGQRWTGQPEVKVPRSRAAGQGDAEAAARVNRGLTTFDELAGGAVGQGRGVREHANRGHEFPASIALC